MLDPNESACGVCWSGLSSITLEFQKCTHNCQHGNITMGNLLLQEYRQNTAGACVAEGWTYGTVNSYSLPDKTVFIQNGQLGIII